MSGRASLVSTPCADIAVGTDAFPFAAQLLFKAIQSAYRALHLTSTESMKNVGPKYDVS